MYILSKVRANNNITNVKIFFSKCVGGFGWRSRAKEEFSGEGVLIQVLVLLIKIFAWAWDPRPKISGEGILVQVPVLSYQTQGTSQKSYLSKIWFRGEEGLGAIKLL